MHKTGIEALAVRAAIPVGLVLAAMLGLQVGYGVAVGDALLYLGYVLAYCLLPGWLVYRLLASRPGNGIRQVAIGGSVGLVLEVFAFMATAAIGARGLFTFFPLILGIPVAAILLRRRVTLGAETDSDLTRKFIWCLTAFGSVAMGLFAIVYFPSAPLPGANAVTYFQDHTWHLALVAEIKNHWPVQDPNVSGEPLPYHYFAHIHMAAASQVTGIGLPIVLFRLFTLPLVLVTALLFVTAGRSLTGSVWSGLLAACLALFVGELQLSINQEIDAGLPFLGVFIDLLTESPSFLFGMPIFLALVVLIGERVAARASGSPGDWALIAILIAGAANAKVAILPLLLGGLLLYTVWQVLTSRRISPAVGWIGLMVIGALGVAYVSLYSGHSSGMALEAFMTLGQMPAVSQIEEYLRSVLPAFPLKASLLTTGGVTFGMVGLLGAQLAGISLLGWGRILRSEIAWLLAVAASAALILLFVWSPGTTNQLYFIFYGIAAGWIAAAKGFLNLWRARPRRVDSWGWIIVILVSWLAVLLIIMRLPLDLDRFTGPDAVPHTLVAWYAGLFGSILLFGLFVYRRLSPRRWWTRMFVTGALVLIGAIGVTADYVKPGLTPSSDEANSEDRQSATSVFFAGDNSVSPGEYAALSYIRENAPEDAVIAVNSTDRLGFKWAAFAERPAFLQGWAYSRQALDAGYDEVLAGRANDLFRDRMALNERAFSGDPQALTELADGYGVEYLVLEDGGGLPVDLERLLQHAELVYSGEKVRVLRLGSAEDAAQVSAG